MCLAIAAPYYKRHSQWLVDKAPKATFTVLILCAGILGGLALQRTAFLTSPWEKAYFPSESTLFILNHKPPANIFNAFEYGGYLGWKLYPTYQIFIDQRNLDYQVFEDYAAAKRGDYQQVFEKYDVNTVIFYHTQPVSQRRPGIVSQLIRDPAWQLVHIDRVASVFVRASKNPDLAVINKNQAAAYLRNITQP